MRICIEMTRTVDAREILSQLFKLTPMQMTFGMAMLALVDGEPRLLPLKRVLIHYLEHRQEIITRRSRYLLERAKERAHILEGLLQALDHIDEVIDTIRRSRTTDTARANLMKALALTEIQAQAILDMPLKRLVALERRKIADEHKEKLAEIKYLEGLLRSPAKIRAVIRENLLQLKAKYGDARRTRIVELEKGHHTARDLVQEEDVLLTLWQDGQVGRSASAPRVSSKAVPMSQVWGNTRDDLALFTASGQAALLPVHQIPHEQDTPVSSLTDLASSETLVSGLVLPHPADGEEMPPLYLTLVTRQGRIKRVTVEDFSSASRGAVTAMNVEEGDHLAWVAQTNGQEEILLSTRQGKAIRFSEEDVRPMGLSAAGVMAIKLGKDDAVVGMSVVREKAFVITVTEKGYAKRTAVADFPAQKRYGGGVQSAKLTSRTGPVAVAALAEERDDVVLVTSKGRVTKLPVKAVSVMGRAASGRMSRPDTQDSYVEPDKHGLPVLLTVLAGSKDAAKPTRARTAGAPEKPSSGGRGGTGAAEPAKKAASTAQKTSRTRPASRAKKTAPAQKQTSKAKSTPASRAEKPDPAPKTKSEGKTVSKREKTPSGEQMPLPMQTPPAKSGQKSTTRKKKPVRSVTQD